MFEASPAGFVAGFAPRHAVAAPLIATAFAPPEGFAAVDVVRRPSPTGPKHFSPASPGHKPTAGWDPLDPEPAIDPAAAAHAAGFAQGHAEATEAAERARARDAALLADLARALTDGFDREGVAERLRRTVLMLVEKLVGETGVSADLLTARVEAATDLLADPQESALLRVHPDDVALLEGKLPKTVFAAGDPHVARGSFVLESASTVVEDGPALWLDQLAQAIDRVPVPSC
jgi:flagellar assembly protein FliH